MNKRKEKLQKQIKRLEFEATRFLKLLGTNKYLNHAVYRELQLIKNEISKKKDKLENK